MTCVSGPAPRSGALFMHGLRTTSTCCPAVKAPSSAPSAMAGPRAMPFERPPMTFRRASVAIQRHDSAATATATRLPRCDAPSAATERPCAARLWESRRRHEQRVRRRVPAPPSDGRERERNLVERARPRSQGPRARKDERGAHTRALVERARPRSQGPRAREDGARTLLKIHFAIRTSRPRMPSVVSTWKLVSTSMSKPYCW